MAFIEQIAESDAQGAVARLYSASRNRAGSVANIIRVMSQDGPSAAQSMQFYVSLMKSENSLDAARREMLATVVSNVNDCFY
jgi:alkylhydroperoxidase family enzyme